MKPEPAAWTIERIDPIGSIKGAAGLYADAPSQAGGGSEIYYDNIKVYREQVDSSRTRGAGPGTRREAAAQPPGALRERCARCPGVGPRAQSIMRT